MISDRLYNKLTATISTLAISVAATGITAVLAENVSAQQTYNRFADYCLNYDSLASAKDKATVKYLLELYGFDGYGASIGDTAQRATWDKVVGTDLCYSAEQYFKQYQHSGTKVEGNVKVHPSVSLSNHQPNGISLPHSGLGPLIGFEQLQALSVTCDGEATNLEAIATLTNLETLALTNCNITDISPLSSLTKLVTLNLEQNSIKDLTPLASLTNLESLHLDHQVDKALKQQAVAEHGFVGPGYIQGYLVDLSPLTSLTNLKLLTLSNNSVEDLSHLNSLSKLIVLNLSDNKITDISSLSQSSLPRLLELVLQGNYIPPEARVCPFEGSYAYHESRCIGINEQARGVDNPNTEAETTPQQTTQPTNTVNTPTSPPDDSPNETQPPTVLDELNRGVEETIEQAPDRILDGLF